MTRALLLLALLLPAATGAPHLRAGLWAIETRPGVATLDGRRLSALPYAAPPPARVCMSEADAADPAKWFARDLPPACTIHHAGLTASTATLEATCPSDASGFPDGRFAMSGSWTASDYRLHFATTAHSANGAMGFTSTTTGHRIGDCPHG